MNIESVAGVASEGVDRAFASAAKSMKRISEGEIELQDLENVNAAKVSVAVNAKMIESVQDMHAALLSSL